MYGTSAASRAATMRRTTSSGVSAEPIEFEQEKVLNLGGCEVGVECPQASASQISHGFAHLQGELEAAVGAHPPNHFRLDSSGFVRGVV